MPLYAIARRPAAPAKEAHWTSGYWKNVPALSVGRFHPHSTRHHPLVEAKVAHSSDAMHVLFRVEDRFVRCQQTEFQSRVCTDSCVEAFLEPVAGKGYFNFEINCGGTLLVFYVDNAAEFVANSGNKGSTKLLAEEGAKLTIVPSLQEKKPFDLTGPVTWTVQCSIPIAVMEGYVGKIGKLDGTWWRGNFYKCADASKYPHWASWASVGTPLRFHQPKRFGDLYFQRLERE